MNKKKSHEPCVYELNLESDDTFKFSFINNAVSVINKYDKVNFEDVVNQTTNTLKVADIDVDKYIFNVLQGFRKELHCEEMNVFVVKKPLNNGITEVCVWGRKGIGSNVNYHYISLLNAPF